MTLQLQSLAGLVAFPLIAWALSDNRAALPMGRVLRIVLAGLALQLAIAMVMLGVPFVRGLFEWPGKGVEALQAATAAGMRLVFGYLAGGPPPFEVKEPQHGFLLAFQALPLILIVSVLAKLLYRWGILQRIVHAFACALQQALGVTGPVGTSAAANIFVGMVEAPLLIRPYLASMSRSGLFATMTVGMATIAGTMLAVYAGILSAKVPGAAGHLIVASVINVPAALMLAALMVPETAPPTIETDDQTPPHPAAIVLDDAPRSSMDAIAQGTREGVDLLVSVTAMLVVAVALVSLTNMILATAGTPFGIVLTLEKLLGWAFSPLAWLTGIPRSESAVAGSLLGIKTVLTEFVAYLNLAGLPPEALSPRSRLIVTYALCGFANLASLGIMIGGISAMVPSRRSDVVNLAPKTVISGTLATLMTAAIVGLVTPG